MSEIITSGQVYLITRLDHVHESSISSSLISVSVVFLIFCVVLLALRLGQNKPIGRPRAWLSGLLGFLGLLGLAVGVLIPVLVPTTKEALIIYGVPLLVNNDKVQAKVGDAVDGTAELLSLAKSYVTGHGADKGKEEPKK